MLMPHKPIVIPSLIITQDKNNIRPLGTNRLRKNEGCEEQRGEYGAADSNETGLHGHIVSVRGVSLSARLHVRCAIAALEHSRAGWLSIRARSI
ncbi:MAG: hypothetical protein Aurels2KO_38940 [Aureliella sp.]